MANRVLTTETAVDTVNKVRNIVQPAGGGGTLNTTVHELKTLLDRLGEPDVWDGQLATRFRGETLPACKTALANCENALNELRTKLAAITNDIMSAGGNAAGATL